MDRNWIEAGELHGQELEDNPCSGKNEDRCVL